MARSHYPIGRVTACGVKNSPFSTWKPGMEFNCPKCWDNLPFIDATPVGPAKEPFGPPTEEEARREKIESRLERDRAESVAEELLDKLIDNFADDPASASREELLTFVSILAEKIEKLEEETADAENTADAAREDMETIAAWGAEGGADWTLLYGKLHTDEGNHAVQKAARR